MSYLKLKLSAVSLVVATLMSTAAHAGKDELYDQLNKDLKYFETELRPYLQSMYENTIDSHNILRVRDFHAAFLYYRSAADQLEHKLEQAYQKLKSLEPNEAGSDRSAILNELNVADKKLADLTVELTQLRQAMTQLVLAWQERSSEAVVRSIARTYNFKDLFPQPQIQPTEDYDSYVFQVSASYYPSTSSARITDFRMNRPQSAVDIGASVAQTYFSTQNSGGQNGQNDSTKNNIIVAALKLIWDVGSSIFNQNKHENKVDDIIGKQVKAIAEVREALHKEQEQLIAQSLKKVMGNAAGETNAVSTKLAELNAALDLLGKDLAERKTELSKKFSFEFKLFHDQLLVLTQVSPEALLKQLPLSQAETMMALRKFQAAADSFVKSEGQQVIEPLVRARSASFEERAEAVAKVVARDAYFTEQYLSSGVLGKDYGFFFSSRDALTKEYPSGTWLNFLGKVYGEYHHAN